MLVCENGDVGSIKLFNVESVFLGVYTYIDEQTKYMLENSFSENY